jgi:hypothetical protein
MSPLVLILILILLFGGGGGYYAYGPYGGIGIGGIVLIILLVLVLTGGCKLSLTKSLSLRGHPATALSRCRERAGKRAGLPERNFISESLFASGQYTSPFYKPSGCGTKRAAPLFGWASRPRLRTQT